jgi:murein DD-endopeptidase MepM/ murein hydrolase activator NlpD
VELAATDASYWHNRGEKALATEIDFTPPQIEVLTQQHSVQAGGSELVLFRVQETKLLSTGIKVGDLFFPASLARGLDPTFPEQSQMYVSIFALPRNWTAASLVRVYAEDEARNVTEIPLRFRAQEHTPETATISLSESFLAEKAEPLIPKYELFIRRYFPERTDELLKTIPPGSDREARFRVVNEGFRGLLDEKLAQIFSATSKDRLWQGEFIKPMPSAVSSTFGEERSFTFEGKPFGGSRHNGFDLASTERDIVRATNEGIVVLSEDFGLYGNTIIIDHGLGIFSLYGHLSVLQVKPGDRVLKGDIIARTGQTGFAGGDHLHFEIRVGVVPVSPIEWWDPHWYKDNVLGKIEAAKNRL